MEISSLLLGILITGIFIMGFYIGKLSATIRHRQMIKGERSDAVMRSRNSIAGKLWENVAPFLPGFKYNPNDMRFIGAPIDYVVFDGMSERDIKRIVFLEVKSGESKLNEQEKKLKDAVRNGRVEWDEYRADNKI